MLFSWLTEKGVLAMNPAREVKTERFSRTEGKTPAFVEGEVQRLLGAIETSTHTGLRDRALLGVLAYTFARIGAGVNLKVEDYYPSGKRFLLRFKEKGGKEKELPVHHKLEELLDEYLKATGLGNEPGSPLFPTALGKTGKLSRRPLVRTDAADMLKRRLKQVGLPAHYSPHSFRATGITNFLENDGTLEAAQRIAGHADSLTTKLYDRLVIQEVEGLSMVMALLLVVWLDRTGRVAGISHLSLRKIACAIETCHNWTLPRAEGFARRHGENSVLIVI
jgi:site-specific recombinase XerD